MSESWAPAAGALLEPGERLVAAEPIRPAAGDQPLPPGPDGSTPLDKRGKVGLAFLHLLSPNITIPGQSVLDRVLFGVAAYGATGSHAQILFTTHLRTPGARKTVLVVTDRRLMVCLAADIGLLNFKDDEHGSLESIWSVPRGEVTAAQVRRLRFRRRLWIAFRDGSWVTFVTPLGESLDPARRLAAALSA